MKILDSLRTTDVALADVERFDLDRDQRLVATVGETPDQRWLRREGEGWRSIRPRDDEQLPFAGELDALALEGRIDVLSWKPGRRLTLAAPYAATRAIYKARRRSAHAEALSVHVGAELLMREGGFTCPPLLAHSREHAVLVFERLDARPLTIGLADTERFRRIGKNLRALQERTPSVYLALHGPRDEERVLVRMRERTLAIVGDEPAGAEALLRRFTRVLGDVRASAPVVAHRDLHDGQFLVRGDELVLLDFDLLCLADSALDVSNLGAHLELRALLGDAGGDGGNGVTEESARACGEALFEGLGRNGDREFHRRVLFYRGATFLRLAWVYHARPRFARHCPELLARARAAFDEFESDA
ncbi:MAG: hypothetical protein IT453_04740 [Planctomycetes bacterium]|nr:hypothetical protein [Planctomycetota bacterium]